MRLFGYFNALLAVHTASAALQWKSHDISSLLVEESTNHVSYYNAAGTKTNLETLLAQNGANNIKIRIWVNPSDGVYNLDYALKLGARAKAAGLSVTLNLHYSDTWADPGHQTTPAAWAGQNLATLANTVKTYTTSVLNAFASAGINVPLVGIGNEIRAGMLWPLGATSNGFSGLSTLLTAAAQGVRASSLSSTSIMIHTDNGYSWSQQQFFYNSLKSAGFDMSLINVQGVSYYPFYSTDGTLANFQTTVNNMVSTYGKKIVVVETDWPDKCSSTSQIPPSLLSSFPFSPAGQTSWVAAVANVLKALPNSAGAGLMYWEPGWIDNAGLGSACSDNVLFDGDWSVPSAVKAKARASISMLAGI